LRVPFGAPEPDAPPCIPRVAKLMLAKEDALTVSRALEPALFYDAKLDV
jgi:hypothetical protein